MLSPRELSGTVRYHWDSGLVQQVYLGLENQNMCLHHCTGSVLLHTGVF